MSSRTHITKSYIYLQQHLYEGHSTKVWYPEWDNQQGTLGSSTGYSETLLLRLSMTQKTLRITQAEALLRLTHQDRGITETQCIFAMSSPSYS